MIDPSPNADVSFVEISTFVRRTRTDRRHGSNDQ